MHVEIEDAERRDLFYLLPAFISDEQFARANLKEADHSISLLINSEIQTLIGAKEPNCRCDSLWKLLCF